MTILVTGAAGFIGSTLVDDLLRRGERVRGVDCFTDYYDPSRKRSNVRAAIANRAFELREVDLVTDELSGLFAGIDIVFHLAAQPGVRPSWDAGFTAYAARNIVATQRLLEASRQAALARFVLASSSSVYGDSKDLPTRETSITAPHSPYGVTKLAAEHLCSLYARNWGVPAVALRYFTVFGPRQRPDMAISRLIDSAQDGGPFPLYGDGSQLRDFTYVDDVIDATRAASKAVIEPGTVINVAGGSSVSVSDLIDLVGRTVGKRVAVTALGEQAGDVRQTAGDISLAADLLGWRPRVSLVEGVARQVAWQTSVA